MFIHRRPEGPSHFFVHTQGFEKRYFDQNFIRYFGESVLWREAVDWASGQEGYEVRVEMHTHIREEILARMRKDAQREFNRAINMRRNESRTIKNRIEGIELSSRITDMRELYLDLFPVPERLGEDLPHGQRRIARSAPVSPVRMSATITHPDFAAPSDLFEDDDDSELYSEPQGIEYDPPYTFEIPTLVLQRAPTLKPPRPLRPSRSEGMLGW